MRKHHPHSSIPNPPTHPRARIQQLDQHRDSYRGYVGMLVVDKPYRKLKLGSELVSRALAVMQAEGADECVLEARRSQLFFFVDPTAHLLVQSIPGRRLRNTRFRSSQGSTARDMRVLFIWS